MFSKKAVPFLFLFAFLIVLITPSFATPTISSYNVQSVIPLNNVLNIDGVYSDTDTNTANVLCSFFLYDAGGDQNQLIIRLTDEYTNIYGNFSTQIKLEEPLFRRGKDYNAVSICATARAEKVFYVDQKEDIAFGITPDALALDVAWFKEGQNSLTLVFLGILIMIVIVVFFAGNPFKR